LKNGFAAVSVIEEDSIDHTDEFEIIEVVETEEVTSFTEIMPVTPPFKIKNEPFDTALDSFKENGLAGLSQVLFESYRTIKLLDNGLILQGEYDNYKRDFDFYVAKLFSANNFCFAIDFAKMFLSASLRITNFILIKRLLFVWLNHIDFCARYAFYIFREL
jgi:hypothetical protein